MASITASARPTHSCRPSYRRPSDFYVVRANRNVPQHSPQQSIAHRNRPGLFGGVSPRSAFFSPLAPLFSNANRSRMNDMMRLLEREMNSTFGAPLEGGITTKEPGEVIGSFPVDVLEDEKCFKFVADCPGVPRSGLKVRVLEDRMLVIEGSREDEHREDQGTRHAVQRFYGKFQRAFHLPSSADESSIKASLKDGVLVVSVGKKEGAEEKANEIPIEDAAQPFQ